MIWSCQGKKQKTKKTPQLWQSTIRKDPKGEIIFPKERRNLVPYQAPQPLDPAQEDPCALKTPGFENHQEICTTALSPSE